MQICRATSTHPHDPYVARRRFWDLYADCDALEPWVGAFAYDEQDPHSKRLLDASDWRRFAITDAHIRRSRQAYFANISYLDEKIGELLAVLERTRQHERTIVLFLSDHGDMLGERGLWFKMSFFEGSARVPLLLAAPGLPAASIEAPVSTLDVLPTLADLAGVDLAEIAPWTDGESLLPVALGAGRSGPVRMEYVAEGSIAPMAALRDERFKLVVSAADPAQLFDLRADPSELSNLAFDPAHEADLERLSALAGTLWDMDAYDREVRESQARRHVVYRGLRNGAYYPWDFQPLQRASERYMRNHMDLNVLEERQRHPRGE